MLSSVLAQQVVIYHMTCYHMAKVTCGKNGGFYDVLFKILEDNFQVYLRTIGRCAYVYIERVFSCCNHSSCLYWLLKIPSYTCQCTLGSTLLFR